MLVLAPAAAAQPERDRELSEAEETALARDLFEQGVRFTRRSDWAAAADRFARALELRDTPQIRHNLAESLYNQGRMVEASEHVEVVTRAEDVPDAVRRSAADLRQRLSAALARLTIRVRGDRGDAHVTLDDREMPDAVLGVETPVDPGHHVVRLLGASGEELDRAEVDVDRGGRADATLVASRPIAAPPGATPPTAPGPARADEGDGAPWWLWAGLVVLVAGAGVGAFLLVGGDEQPTQGDFMPGVIEVR